jgi:hypothetical protein
LNQGGCRTRSIEEFSSGKVDGKIRTEDTLKIDRRRSIKIYLNDRKKSKNDTIEN